LESIQPEFLSEVETTQPTAEGEPELQSKGTKMATLRLPPPNEVSIETWIKIAAERQGEVEL